jgi:hypothetical protein
LLSGYCGGALQLPDCLVGDEASGPEPVDAESEESQTDQERRPAYRQASPPDSEAGSGQAGNCRLEQNYQSGDQQHRASDDQTKRHADLADFLRHLGPRELTLLPHQLRELVQQIDKDR